MKDIPVNHSATSMLATVIVYRQGFGRFPAANRVRELGLAVMLHRL
jgi:hypothetical protein